MIETCEGRTNGAVEIRPRRRKEPPGNRAAPSLGRIVPTEAKPSELSGCIVGAGDESVKENSRKK
jgi:hypothetical protein